MGIRLSLTTLALLIGSAANAQDPVAPDAKTWIQAQGAVSVLDTRTDTPVQRLNVGTQIGYRPGRVGFFVDLEMNRSIDYGRVSPDFDFVQVGPGVDYFWKERNLRSSVSAGSTFLTREAGGDPAGHRGWYLDARPISIRYPMDSGATLELTPLSIDVSKPSSNDDFSLYGNFLIVAYEWPL